MILTPHAIVGATVANIFPENPVLGSALAFASHYFLDTLPHRDYEIEHLFNKDVRGREKAGFKNIRSAIKFFSSVGFDLIFGIFIAIVIFAYDNKTFYLTLLGIAFGILPDFLQFLYFKFKNWPWTMFQKIHDAFHHPDKMLDRSIIGSLTQIVAAGLFLFFYFLFK